MKSKLCTVFLLIILSTVLSLSQDSSPIATFSPEHIKLGDNISVTYNSSAKEAKLSDEKEIIALCVVYRGEDTPLLMETNLTQNGSEWKGSFTLTEKNARHLGFQFISGDDFDNNNGNGWNMLVYGADGKPVFDAHHSLAQMYEDGGSVFGENKDHDRAKTELSKEFELYPNNPEARMFEIQLSADLEKTPENTSILESKLDTLINIYQNDEKKLKRIAFFFSMIGEEAVGKAITDSAIARNPKGYLALQAKLRPYTSEKNIVKGAEIAEAVFAEFPNMEEKQKQSICENITFKLANAREFDKAEVWLKKMPAPNGVYYNYVAKTLTDDSVRLETALILAKRANELNRSFDIKDKPSDMRVVEWNDQNKSKLAASLGTTGYALMKMSRFNDAEPYLKEAYETYNGTNPDVNQRYVHTLNMNQRYDQAISIGLECVKKLYDNAKLLDNLKYSYVMRDGSDKNYSEVTAAKRQSFTDAIAKATKEHATEIDKRIKEDRTKKPAMDFTINDMAGNPVTLSTLKGRVVVIDFWATWCGPCKQSFPYLQYLYENYQNNDDVKFFAVNTFERISGESAILENTKKFIAANKYTFPVLMDTKDVANHFEVNAIPTQIIIDKFGNIAYTTIGFDGPQMVDEVTKKIELLVKE